MGPNVNIMFAVFIHRLQTALVLFFITFYVTDMS